MDQRIAKHQSLGRATLLIALNVATWLGVTAMGFGLISWAQSSFSPTMVLTWIQNLLG
jgi:hypothetical protein